MAQQHQPAPPNTPHRLTRTQSNPATSATTHTLPLTPALQTRSLGTPQHQNHNHSTNSNSNGGDLRSQLFSRVKEFFITLSSAPGGGGLGSGQLSEVNILVGLTVWLQAKGYAASLMRTAPGLNRPVEHFFVSVSVRPSGEAASAVPPRHGSSCNDNGSETDAEAEADRALLIDPFYKPFFEIARPTPAYAEYLQRLPTIFIGTQHECHRTVAEITSQIIQSFTSTDMAMAPWRSSAVVSKYWANYRPDTDRVAAHRKRLASAASLTASPASAAVSTPGLQRTVSADHTATPKTPIRTLSSLPTAPPTTPAASVPPRTPGAQPQQQPQQQPQSAYASAQLSRTKSAPFTPATPQQKKPPTNSNPAATATATATTQSNLHYDSRTSSNSSNSSASDYAETAATHNTAPQSRYVTRQNSNPTMPPGLQSPATPAAKKPPPAQHNQHNHQLQRTHSTPANLDVSVHGYTPQRQNSDQHNHTNAPGFVSPRGAHQNQPQQVSKYANLITSPRGNQNQNQNQGQNQKNFPQHLTSPRENTRDTRNTSSHHHNRNKALNQLEVDKLPGHQILPQNEPGTSKQNSTHAASVHSVVLTNA